MNREQEALLQQYHAEGKVNASYTFWVRHKLTGKVSPILGSMVSGFLCPKTYELFDENPDAAECESEAENAPVVAKRKKR